MRKSVDYLFPIHLFLKLRTFYCEIFNICLFIIFCFLYTLIFEKIRYKEIHLEFNNAQKQAICHVDGPMLVLAGPGSGKTAVITERTYQLINKSHINPSHILVITFTKAAANEMKQRFERRIELHEKAQKAINQSQSVDVANSHLQYSQNTNAKVTFGTFHAIFFMVLKLAYGYNASNIVTDEQKYKALREITSHFSLEYRDENEFLGGVLSEISMIKNARIPLEHFYSSQCGSDIFRKIYKEYEVFLKRNRLIDFDDMLLLTYELFCERPDILSAWQKKYRYILVDEFQDINQLQWDILRMLALPENNLFIVGDDDQSIYRFRGSKPEIMMHIPKEYPNLKQIELNINYRCEKPIVEEALRLIGHNKERFPKNIIPFKNEKKQYIKTESVQVEDVQEKNKKGNLQIERGTNNPPLLYNIKIQTMQMKTECMQDKNIQNCVRYHTFENQRQEILFIIKEIEKHLKTGGTLSDIAILFRTNMQPRFLMEQFMAYNVDFKTKDRIPNLYEHWIAKDVFTYIRIAKGSRVRADFLQIMNKPTRYIGRDSLCEAEVSFDEWVKLYDEQPWIAERIERLYYDIKMLANMSPYATVNYIRRGIGYDDYIEEYANYRNLNKEDLYDILEELQASAKGFQSYEEWETHIEECSKELKEKAKQKTENPNAVTLATLHSAKGLEFQHVFLIDVNEGIMPYKKAVLEKDIEEERRLFYVGMTRAISNLTICSVKELHNKQAEPSRFVKEAQGIQDFTEKI